MSTAALLLALALPLADEWTALPRPALCSERPVAARVDALGDGRHLRREETSHESPRDGRPARLPASLWTQMLEEDARARGGKLEFFRGTQDPLVRGDAAAVAAARALTVDLDRAGRALAIDLDATLTPGPAREESLPPSAMQQYAVRLTSGDATTLGKREVQTYLSSFHVEVAADSGVAEPVMGTVLYGTTLTVRATRVDGGKRVFVHGVLDVAELASIESFDPDTIDLGVLQQPVVHAAQAVFAGAIESGKALDVVLASPLLSTPEWKLSLRATARADAAGESDTGWQLFDLAFLASEAPVLEPCRPGIGFDADVATESGATAAALPPSAIAAALETSRTKSNPRASIFWTNDLLFVPRSEPGLAARAGELVRAAESARLRTGRVDVRAGGARTSLPVVAGVAARWISVVERPWLTDYRADLAPQTWMPKPEVSATLDGLCLSIAPAASSAQCTIWSTATQPSGELARSAAQLGRLQRIARSASSTAAEIVAGEPERALLESFGPPPQNGAVLVRYAAP